MKLENTYCRINGKHQDKANILFKLFSRNGLHDKDKKSKQLKKLAKFFNFYIDVNYNACVYRLNSKNRILKKSYIFNLAIHEARKEYNYKYKCKSLSQLEKMIDKLILKAYKEQKKLGKI